MTKAVVDSSVIVKWVSSDKELHLEQADKLLNDVKDGRVEMMAPELAKYEVGNALLKKGLTYNQVLQCLGTVYSVPVRFVIETEKLAGETHRLANEVRSARNMQNFTYYDASFAALAKEEKAVLITANPKHHCQISGIKVVNLEKY